MIHSPPPEPPPNRDPLRFDDFMGIFVAFASIGAIFWWSLSQNEKGLDLSLFQPFSTATSPTATPTPIASPIPNEREIANIGAEKPQPLPSVIPQPSPSPNVPFVPVPIPAEPVPSPVRTVETGFSDVPRSYWASPFIAELAQRGIVDGFPDRTFRPEQPVTRAEFANLLEKAFNRSENSQSLRFKDLRSGYWANLAIDRAVEMGFMKGYPGNFFEPNQPISRTESLVALANGLKLTSSSPPEQVISFYQDAGQIPRYAIEEVAAATTAGLVVNYPERTILDPQEVTNRAEAAALIYQALVQAGQVPQLSSPYIVQP